MSKLYTEEQVKQMIEKSKETGLTAEYLILTTPSIQLPTDEEIKMIIKHYHNSLFYLELSERELENITKIIYKELFGGQDNE